MVQVNITQAPILVVDSTSQEVRITQLVMQVLSIPSQPLRITQTPIQVLNHPIPVSLPLPLIPEVPVVETWNYKTITNIAESAKEQRSSLRPDPKIGLSFDAYLLDEDERRHAYNVLQTYTKRLFYYPNYVYSSNMNEAAAVNDTQIYFNPALADMRVGEPVAFVNKQTHETKLSTTINPDTQSSEITTIATVNTDGVTFAAPLSFEVQKQWVVCPVSTFRFTSFSGLQMQSVSGDLSLEMETANSRTLLRPDQAVTIPTIDSIPILDKRPLANSSVEENFNQNVEWLDNDINKVEPRTLWSIPYISGERQFIAHRPADIDFWREFANTVRGKWKSFILSTFRNDIPLSVNPALDATVLVSSNIWFYGVWRQLTYRYIRIDRATGPVYRRIHEVTMNYNVEGAPESINIKLSASIGNNVGDNDISVISFANLVRLDNDTIKLNHYEADTIVSLNVRMINS